MPAIDWRDAAACRYVPPGIFFPDREDGQHTALAICAACPVRATCLRTAVDAGERYGIWGGVDTAERKRLARRVRRSPNAHSNQGA
jgi:WhiB family redox-sensing transcriptional regulator